LDFDTLYGQCAVHLGYISPEEAQLCVQLKMQSGGQYSLEQILLQRGTLNPGQAQVVRQRIAQYQNQQNAQQSYGYNTGYSDPQRPPSSSGMPVYNYGGSSGMPTGQTLGQSSGYVQMAPQNSGGASFQGSIQGSFVSPVSNGTPTYADSQTLSNSAMPTVGSVFGRYRIDAVLGKGGMGIVYRAFHLDLKRNVALKMLLSGVAGSEKQLTRFRNEHRAAGNLSHPNIVPLHDVGEVDGLHYFTMDYVEGTDLSSELTRRKFSEEEALELTRKLADALGHAHSQSPPIVHRDLKPANILISSADGEPRITDFGIAKIMDGQKGETLSGEVLGTPAYMSPEQADGSPSKIDGRADIFSLGTILYEMLYGEQAFKGATQYAVVTQVLTEDPEPPILERKRISLRAEAICFKCLAKKRPDRYQSMAELSEDIDLVLAGKAPRAPLRQRPGEQVDPRQRIALYGIAGLIAVAMLALHWSQSSALSELVRIGLEHERQYTLLMTKLRDAMDRDQSAARKAIELARGELDAHAVDSAVAEVVRAFELAPTSPRLLIEGAGVLLRGEAGVEESVQALLRGEALLELLNSDEERATLKGELARLMVLARWLQKNAFATRQAIKHLIEAYPEAAREALVQRITGQLAMQDRAWKEAALAFDEALRKEPDDPVTRANLAYSLVCKGSFERARDEAERALQMDDDLALAHYSHAMAQTRLDHPREARVSLTRAQQRGLPDFLKDDAATLEREISNSIARLDRESVRPPPNLPKPPVTPPPGTADTRAAHDEMHKLLDQGVQAAQGGDSKSAEAHLTKAEKIGVTCPSSMYTRGVLLEGLGRIDDALKSYETAIKSSRSGDPTIWRFYFACGEIHAKKKDLKRATECVCFAYQLYRRQDASKQLEPELKMLHQVLASRIPSSAREARLALTSPPDRESESLMRALGNAMSFLAKTQSLGPDFEPAQAQVLWFQSELLLAKPDLTPDLRARALQMMRESTKHGLTGPDGEALKARLAALEGTAKEP
jgi:tetratricopeptide (TPR) repeat protein